MNRWLCFQLVMRVTNLGMEQGPWLTRLVLHILSRRAHPIAPAPANTVTASAVYVRKAMQSIYASWPWEFLLRRQRDLLPQKCEAEKNGGAVSPQVVCIRKHTLWQLFLYCHAQVGAFLQFFCDLLGAVPLLNFVDAN